MNIPSILLGACVVVVALVLLIVMLSILVAWMENAPEGWEDSNGFHRGRRP